MSNDSLMEAKKRKGFYPRGAGKLMTVVMMLAVINIVLIARAGYLLVTKDESVEYYAVTCDSDPIKLNSLSAAIVSSNQLLQWANVAAIAAYNYNFVNWRQRMDELRPYFSKQGWEGFYPEFRSSQVDPMVEKKTVVSAVAIDVPVIERRGVMQGRYTWRVAVPLLVSYQTASVKTQEKVLIRLVISRVPVVQTPRGIAIMQFNTSRFNG